MEIVWQILSWIMCAVALAGIIINADRNKYGFAFWIVSNLYMVIRFAVIGEYAQMTLRGIYLWSKKGKT